MTQNQRHHLFRGEVFENISRNAEGSISLAQAKYTKAMVAAALIFIIPLLIFIGIGSYTKRTTVSGKLAPAQGAIRIVPNPAGIISAVHVVDGQRVKKGQALYSVNDERRITTGDTSQRLADSLQSNRENREGKLNDAIKMAEVSQIENDADAQKKIAMLQQQMSLIRDEILILNRRILNATEVVKKFESLAQKKYFSEDAVRDKEDIANSLKAQAIAEERQLVELQRNITQVDKDRNDAKYRISSQINDLKRQLATIERESIEDDVRTRYTITAPEDGTITASAVHVGDTVGGKPIATLLPQGSPLEVHLFATSKEIGFVKKDQKVKLRYRAFPYQKYGQLNGVITYVSLAPFEATELPVDQQNEHEDKYKITVRPEAQFMSIDGGRVPLISGMMVDANIFQEKRRLIEWIFDPLKVISGTLLGEK